MNTHTPFARLAQPLRHVTLTFPSPIKQTGNNTITVPAMPMDFTMITDEFRTYVCDCMGGKEGTAFLMAMEQHIANQFLLKQIIAS